MAAEGSVSAGRRDPVEQHLPTSATYLIVSGAVGATVAVLNEGAILGAAGVLVGAAVFVGAARRSPAFFYSAWLGRSPRGGSWPRRRWRWRLVSGSWPWRVPPART